MSTGKRTLAQVLRSATLAAALIMPTALTSVALAAPSDNQGLSTVPTKSERIHSLVKSLAAELSEEAPPTAVLTPAKTNEVTVIAYLSRVLSGIFGNAAVLIGAAPDLPRELHRAVMRFDQIRMEYHGSNLLVRIVIVLLLAFGARWLFSHSTRAARSTTTADTVFESAADRLRFVVLRAAMQFGAVGAFAIGAVVPLSALDWSPLARETVLGGIIALMLVQTGIAFMRVLLLPGDDPCSVLPIDRATAGFWRARLIALSASLAIIWVLVQEGIALELSSEAVEVIGYTLGLGLVAGALEAIWRSPATVAEAKRAGHHRHSHRIVRDIALTIGVILEWLLWFGAIGITRVRPGFWLVLVLIVVPFAIPISRRAVRHLLRPLDGHSTSGIPRFVEVGAEHGVRALWIITTAALLSWAWNIDLLSLAGDDNWFGRIVHGVLASLVILLIADVLWHVTKAAIDAKLTETAELGEPNSEDARRRARIHTLLPIFRNIVLVFVIAVAATMAMAQLGVQIGPLIAGASVVGVAIGLGAQSFVRDVIGGMFYLIDDAFRVGEYIQSNNYKGTVEGFSLRSVRLRHHRGPVYTVPFSLLGAIQNQSRDWVIDKMMIGVTYDSDLERARKLIKQIGQELANQPEFAPLIIEPLKMQGVEMFGDYSIKIRLKMMTVPGEQFVIRRKAYAMIKKAFEENGIKFAFPTVAVSGGGETANSAAAQQALELTRPVAAE